MSLKKRVLELLAIKLPKETHTKFRKFLSKIALISYVLILLVALVIRFQQYSQSSNLLDNGNRTEVDIVLEERVEDASDPEKISYYYLYSTAVDESQLSGEFYAKKVFREQWGEQATVTFAYLADDLNQAAAVKALEELTSFGKFIKWFVILILVAAIAVWIIFELITSVIVIPKKST